MMRHYAKIDGGVVSNIVVGREDWDHGGGFVLAPAGVQIGWGYDGQQFVPPPPEPVPTPSVVSMRQARLALLARGLLGAVDSAITSIPDNAQRQAAAIEWEYATEVHRASPFVGLLALALGLDEVAVDQLFTEAGAL